MHYRYWLEKGTVSLKGNYVANASQVLLLFIVSEHIRLYGYYLHEVKRKSHFVYQIKTKDSSRYR